MAEHINWHGTTKDSQDLQRALNRHCSCRLASDRQLIRCGPHQLLVGDQQALKRLLFARHIAQRLLREELALDPPLD